MKTKGENETNKLINRNLGSLQNKCKQCKNEQTDLSGEKEKKKEKVHVKKDTCYTYKT